MVGESWVTTTLEKLEEWGQGNSFWPLPFGTACCAIEFMSVVSSHYDMARFGYEVVRFSPRQSDLLIVAGTITDKMAPVLKRIYDQMPDPKWVVSMGACACSGGFELSGHLFQRLAADQPRRLIEALERNYAVGWEPLKQRHWSRLGQRQWLPSLSWRACDRA